MRNTLIGIGASFNDDEQRNDTYVDFEIERWGYTLPLVSEEVATTRPKDMQWRRNQGAWGAGDPLVSHSATQEI